MGGELGQGLRQRGVVLAGHSLAAAVLIQHQDLTACVSGRVRHRRGQAVLRVRGGDRRPTGLDQKQQREDQTQRSSGTMEDFHSRPPIPRLGFILFHHSARI